jgi:hypothetical protein
VSDDRLSKSASGLDVTGVPSLFKIGGSAVRANVTATNLNTLTAGPSSNADANHGHAALRTTLGGTGFVVGDPVYMTGINSIGKAAANSSSTARVVGIPVTSLGSNQYMVVSHGVVTGSWGLTVGTPYYLGRDGGIAEFSALQSGDRVIRLGYGLNYAMLMLNIQDMGQKA